MNNPIIRKPMNPRLSLRFSPTAWAKLLYFRDRSDNEVGGFGISDPADLLYVKDFITVKQTVTCVSVKFDDDAVADFFEDQVVLGRKPEQFARLWCHTHPADIASPSMTDEMTFARVFGSCQWAVMFILAQDNQMYARLSFHIGPGGQVLIPTQVDYSQPFGPTDVDAWNQEYQKNVLSATQEVKSGQQELSPAIPGVLSEFDQLSEDPYADQLAIQSDFWDEEGLFL